MSLTVIDIAKLPDQDEDIFVVGEIVGGELEPTVYELLGAAKELTQTALQDNSEKKVSVIIAGTALDQFAENLVTHGADRVYLVEDEKLGQVNDEILANVIYDVLALRTPEIVLAGATHLGRSVMPRIAAKFKTGLSADVTSLCLNADGILEQTKPAFKDLIQAVIICSEKRPQMTTVRPRIFAPPIEDPERDGEIVFAKPDQNSLVSRAVQLEILPKVRTGKALEEANVVIGVGRGIGGKENLRMIEELAVLLEAEIGATRPLIDEGYFGHDVQIGQSGKIIAPRLYIACGISGALQHTVGIERAKVIVAINKDPQAPIFKVAHYGIVGDIAEVIPYMIKRLRG